MDIHRWRLKELPWQQEEEDEWEMEHTERVEQRLEQLFSLVSSHLGANASTTQPSSHPQPASSTQPASTILPSKEDRLEEYKILKARLSVEEIVPEIVDLGNFYFQSGPVDKIRCKCCNSKSGWQVHPVYQPNNQPGNRKRKMSEKWSTMFKQNLQRHVMNPSHDEASCCWGKTKEGAVYCNPTNRTPSQFMIII